MINNEETEVTVVVRTTGEREKIDTLRLVIESINSQVFENFDIIIVTSGNEENITELLDEMKLKRSYKVIKSPFKNRCIQANIGIKLAGTPFVAIIDDDMVLDNNWLKDMVKSLNTVPEEVACVYSRIFPLAQSALCYRDDLIGALAQALNNTLSIARAFHLKNIRVYNQKLVESPILPSNCMLCRRKALMEVGLYDVRLQEPMRGDDYDLGIRLRKKGYKIVCNRSVKAIHLENYVYKWLMKKPAFFKNLALTETYILMKNKDMVKLRYITFHFLYRIIEASIWTYRTRNLLTLPSVILGIAQGTGLGLKVKS